MKSQEQVLWNLFASPEVKVGLKKLVFPQTAYNFFKI
jgi:hypothetical protein